MHYVYLAYGLSFVIMGFAMAFQSFSSFRILPRRPLIFLASFGITHGLYELQRMFQIMEMRGLTNASPAQLDYAAVFLLPISFMLLFAFALELLIEEGFIGRYWRIGGASASILVALLALFPGWSRFRETFEWPLRLEIASRYFLAFPAGVLACYALQRVARSLGDHDRFRFVLAMYASSFLLLLYGVVAGILVLNPAGFNGYPEHGIATSTFIMEIRTLTAASLTLVISYAFLVEMANVESSMRRMRDEFSAVLAHDIGNILSAIKMSSEIVSSEELVSSLGETTKRLMRTIDSNTKLLQNLIAELLDMSLIELHRFNLEKKKGDLGSVINQICEQMRPVLGSRSLVILKPEQELTACFDQQRVGQILINLLSNAAKYSFLDSEVIVSAYESGPDIKVTVCSTGPVVPKKEALRLFTRYYRSKANSNQKGAGLGLFIVKELVEAHGGEAFVEAQESGKTIFGFTIPKGATLSTFALQKSKDHFS